MRARSLLPALGACLILAVGVSTSAADFDLYRGFRLASSAADVARIAGASDPQIKTLHQRPALLQELRWRPGYSSQTAASGADPVREIVFSFVDDQLFQIAVEYDRGRTAGLTTPDMIAALSGTYGAQAPLPPSSPRAALDAEILVAHWREGDATVALRHHEYGGGYSLVVASVPLGKVARTAQVAAVALDEREAPAREAALLKQRADAAREAAEKLRSTNKDAFRP